MSTKQEQVFMDPNPGVVATEIQRMVREGWSVDENRPMCLLGYMWEVWFMRDATDSQIEKDAAEAAKPSRAEILANARAKKAEKARVAEAQIDAVAEAVEQATGEATDE